ncbi:hypothetical protein RB2150_03648 [Rhodobacterales bacterium HTCC2150]|nr:hypothetical protein RB2150_03648 [Rhodobacterales bacterium HTCC2150] [Rhodobacteraceae bacterium HTCC2150]
MPLSDFQGTDFSIISSSTEMNNLGTYSVTAVTSITFTDGGVVFTLSGSNNPGHISILNTASGFSISESLHTDTYVLEIISPTGIVFTGSVTLAGSFSLSSSGYLKVVTSGTGTSTGDLIGDGALGDNGSFSHTFSVAGQTSFTLEFNGPGMKLYSLTANLSCFCAGTKISTPSGAKEVENLSPGDKILRADNSVATVRWLGKQDVYPRFQHPDKINPIKISAGALGENLPKRDLMLSPDHAIMQDGTLINASALINGTSIQQVKSMPKDGFTYYHVETDDHELLLAEGLAAETFIDYATRDAFDGEGNPADLIDEMPLPRVSSARALPPQLRAKIKSNAA